MHSNRWGDIYSYHYCCNCGNRIEDPNYIMTERGELEVCDDCRMNDFGYCRDCGFYLERDDFADVEAWEQEYCRMHAPLEEL